ncbi:hypothetical protein ABFG93_04950 [Pseudalkalibacillus hwajinpoensis]|uniref:hypothetical protein n=1 Tax=Guptibacillus hwajinpoensis TaxID=208199 RepID=UPI00325B64FC
MEESMKREFDNLQAKDKTLQYEAYNHILEATTQEVDWAYDVWEELLEGLTAKDNHQRSRCAQFLSHLAISDPKKRILNDFEALWDVTKDPKFVTARHSLQAIWRVGLAGVEQRKLVISYLVDRFLNCEDERNHTLIRADILQGLKHLYDEVKDEEIRKQAMNLIESLDDPKYIKKYRLIWK